MMKRNPKVNNFFERKKQNIYWKDNGWIIFSVDREEEDEWEDDKEKADGVDDGGKKLEKL